MGGERDRRDGSTVDGDSQQTVAGGKGTSKEAGNAALSRIAGSHTQPAGFRKVLDFLDAVVSGGAAHPGQHGATQKPTGGLAGGGVPSGGGVGIASGNGHDAEFKQDMGDFSLSGKASGANTGVQGEYDIGDVSINAGLDRVDKPREIGVEVDYDKKPWSLSAEANIDQDGVELAGEAKRSFLAKDEKTAAGGKKKSSDGLIEAHAMGGVDHGTPEAEGDVKIGEKKKFGGSVNASVGSDGPAAGASAHIKNKQGNGVDFGVQVGEKGLTANVTAQIKSVKIGVVMKNLSVVWITIDIGPKHPEVNEILRIALGTASAFANPIPFGIGVGFRLARKLIHKKKKPAGDGKTPVAVITPAQGAALTNAGAIKDGYLNLGLAMDEFDMCLGGAELEEPQRDALHYAHADGEDWLPDEGDTPLL